ncbi:MAG: glutamate racemase [Spirochaetaceae bacterium]|nr:glutamate racemase [Spirochaetaceae bacterium]
MAAKKQRPIAFIDSGVGGLPYLLWLRNHRPEKRLVYLADHAHFPYGIRGSEEISSILVSQSKKLKKKENPSILVVACNSASVSALQELREHMDIPVVGVVPAIKLAASLSSTGRVGILATKTTIKTDYLKNLIDSFASNCQVSCHGATELVDYVEKNLLSRDFKQLDILLKPYIDEMLKEGIDHLVLGCTHFTFFDHLISTLSKGKIVPVDSREGVGRLIERLLDHENNAEGEMDSASINKEKDTMYVTAEKEDGYYKQIAQAFEMHYGGII